MPSFLNSHVGYIQAETEINKLLDMARYSKVIEFEKCKQAREESIFNINCLILEFEYTFSTNAIRNDSSNFNSTFSSMNQLFQDFHKNLKFRVENEGNVHLNYIPQGVIYLKINIESNMTQCLEGNEMKIQQLFMNSSRPIKDYKIFIEFESKNGNTIDCKKLLNDSPSTPILFLVTIFKGLNLKRLKQYGNVFIENCNITDVKLTLVNYAIVQNSQISGGLGSGPLLSLFKNVKYEKNENSALIIEFTFGERSIVSECEITFYHDDFTLAATSLWFINSTINIEKLIFIEEVTEIVFIGCFINTKGSSSLVDGSLNILFSNLVRIDETIFGKSNKGNLITIGESVDVQFISVQFIGSVNQDGSIVTIRNSRNVSFSRCLFVNNRGNIGILSLHNIVSAFILDSEFRDNQISTSGGCLYVISQSSHKTIVSSSNFIRNKSNGSGAAISSYQSGLIIYYSQFIENYSNSGGAVSGISSNTVIVQSLFLSNSAERFGGAIVCTGNFTSISSQFLNNSVHSQSKLMCSSKSYSCLGNGGALSFIANDPNTTQFIVMDSTFKFNRAVRGGAISFDKLNDNMIYSENVEISQNRADYSGGGIFFHHPSTINSQLFLFETTTFNGNVANFYGNQFGSSIHTIQWKVLKENSFGKIEGDFETIMNGNIILFPGQRFTLKPTCQDIFGNSIHSMWESYSISIDNSLISVTIPKQTRVSEIIEGIFLTSSQSTFSQPIKAFLFISFIHTKSSIEIELTPCPDNYESIEAIYGSESWYICKIRPNHTTIIIIAVIASFFVFCGLLIILLAIGYGFFKLTKRIIYWTNRERVEKDIEKRLLENDIVDAQKDFRNFLEDSQLKSGSGGGGGGFIITLDRLFIEKKIGEGGYGVVFKGRWDHNTVAIKCLRVDDETVVLKDDIEREASLLCKLRHPNVLMFYGISITPKKHYLIVEYLEKGSLEQLITQCRKGEISLDLITKISFLIDVSCGMDYLHNLKPPIIHRDLKPGNILLDSNHTAKVCDFGLSRLMTNNYQNSTHMTMGIGTLFYIAPELFDISEISNTNSSAILNTSIRSIDVYSFAIIMYELFFEENPYIHSRNSKISVQANQNEVSPFTILPRVIKGERPIIPFNSEIEMDSYLKTHIPEFEYFRDLPFDDLNRERFRNNVGEFIELMKQCWSSNPIARPSFSIISAILSSLKSRLIIESSRDH